MTNFGDVIEAVREYGRACKENNAEKEQEQLNNVILKLQSYKHFIIDLVEKINEE
jgi:hypothetical protein